jgi:Uma2 family endonuclease
MVGLEWRFQVRPPGEIRRTLVPDVAYFSYGRLPLEELEQAPAPAVAPDAVVETRSPSHRQEDIDEKVRVYLAAGTNAVFLVDPRDRSVIVVDASGVHDVSRGPVTHESLPGFSLDPATLFDFPKPR